MKHRFKNRVLSLVLSVCMMMPIMTQAMPVYSVDEEVETLGAFTTPFTEQTPITLPDNTTTTSKSYRIPSMVTLNDGTIVAAADIRWNTTYDGGGLDTLVARSIDGGASWDYTLANYLGDNGNEYNAQSTTFIDSSLLVGADGQTVYMLVDLYAYGIALNGKWNTDIDPFFDYPSPDTGFNTAGFLKLTNDGTNYNYYLDGGSIWEEGASEPVSGYIVDAKFNITNTDTGETSNLFFETSPYRVARTQFLYLTKSEDGGATWSDPTLLNLRDGVEDALLVSPGNAVLTSDGTMVFPAYSYDWAPTNDSYSASNQHMTLIYAKNNQYGELEWHRSPAFMSVSENSRDTVAEFSSEGSVVELADGKTIRVFFRNKTAHMCYADFDITTGTWIGMEELYDVPTNSDTQLSAITYSKTLDGKQVILVSCPTGPTNVTGTSDGNGAYRTNGKIHVFTVNSEENNSLTLVNTVNLFTTPATGALSGNYTEADGFFAYSSMTERTDGSIAILYENNQFGWGAGDNIFYTITGKAFSEFDLIGGLEIEEGVREKVLVDADVTEVMLYNVTETGEVVSYGTTIPASELDDVYYIVGSYYDTTTHTLLYKVECCVGAAWPEGYEEYRYVPAAVLDKTDSGIAYPIVNFTNAASFRKFTTMEPRAAYNLRTRLAAAPITGATGLATDGLALSKTVNDNVDGTYTVTLEAFTTGTVTTQESTKPMDIVLVIDQSGSMAQCIECGQNMLDKEGSYFHDVSYTRVYNSTDNPLDQTKRYYIFYRQNYTEVEYRDGSWRRVNSTSNDNNSYTPNTSRWDGNTQFFEKSREAGACTRRYDALVSALNGFVTEVRAKAIADPNNPVPHRIAIVGFSSDGYYNSEILTGVTVDSNGTTDINDNNTKYYPDSTGYNGVQYGSNITTAQYQSALQNVSTDAGYTNVTTAIGYLTAHGGTQTLQGMEMALNILQNKTESTIDRDEVVILFTDGATNTNPRSGLITNAHNIKNRDATIYTIGIFEDADGSVPDTAPDILNDNNDLMHLISSNYPDSRMNGNNLITGNKNTNLKGDDSFYLSAGDAEALNDIFVSISSTMGSVQSELTSSAVVRDIVAPQFVVPSNASAVKVYQLAYTPSDSTDQSKWWGVPEELNSADTVRISGDTVDVTGFDFKSNFVAEQGRKEGTGTSDDNPIQSGSFYGRKLRIVFTVSVDPEFLGGSGVYTNGANSGVYNEGVLQRAFERPQVDVPLKQISTVVQDKNIYVSNSTDLTGLLNLYVKRDDLNQNLQVTVDGVNNAYVNLDYTITLNENTVATYFIPAGSSWSAGTWTTQNGQLLQNYLAKEDTSFSVTCVMTDPDSIWDPSRANGTASINVFYPVVTFKDVREKVPNESKVAYSTENYVSVVWKHGDTVASNMEGTAPTLTFTYQPDDGCVDANGLIITYDDFHVNVIKVVTDKGAVLYDDNDSDVPDNIVTFVHDNCDGSCGFDPNKGEFMIHMKKVLTSLTIQKSGWQDVDPNQSFLFRVTGDGVDLTVTVVGNGSTTITGLRVSKTYQVVEITDWSWRYTNQGVDKTTTDATTATVTSTVVANGAEVILNAADADNVITFKNDRTNQYWLDGDSYCENWWGGNDGTNLVKRNGQNNIVTEENS